jgi:hypothetical protein
MKNGVCLLLALSAVFLGAVCATAQTQPPLPNVLWIYREDIKPARGPAHERVERGFGQLWAKAKVEPFLVVEAMSGVVTEMMFLSGYDSLAAMEKDYQTFGKASSGPEYDSLARQEAEVVNSIRSMVAVVRPDLSYLPDRFMNVLPLSRYLSIETFRVRLGHDADFAAGSKLFQSGFQKMKSERPYVMYQVVMGAPEGTYLLFTTMKSLKEVDDDFASQGALMQAIGDENMRNLMKSTGDVFVSMETNIYAFNPNVSHVSKEFAAGDPKFWTPAPMAKKAPAAKVVKKEAAKPPAPAKP